MYTILDRDFIFSGVMKTKIFHDGSVPGGNRRGGLWAYLCHSYTDSKNTNHALDELFHYIALNNYNSIF